MLLIAAVNIIYYTIVAGPHEREGGQLFSWEVVPQSLAMECPSHSEILKILHPILIAMG